MVPAPLLPPAPRPPGPNPALRLPFPRSPVGPAESPGAPSYSPGAVSPGAGPVSDLGSMGSAPLPSTSTSTPPVAPAPPPANASSQPQLTHIKSGRRAGQHRLVPPADLGEVPGGGAGHAAAGAAGEGGGGVGQSAFANQGAAPALGIMGLPPRNGRRSDTGQGVGGYVGAGGGGGVGPLADMPPLLPPGGGGGAGGANGGQAGIGGLEGRGYGRRRHTVANGGVGQEGRGDEGDDGQYEGQGAPPGLQVSRQGGWGRGATSGGGVRNIRYFLLRVAVVYLGVVVPKVCHKGDGGYLGPPPVPSILLQVAAAVFLDPLTCTQCALPMPAAEPFGPGARRWGLRRAAAPTACPTAPQRALGPAQGPHEQRGADGARGTCGGGGGRAAGRGDRWAAADAARRGAGGSAVAMHSRPSGCEGVTAERQRNGSGKRPVRGCGGGARGVARG